jgi:hypothetical protein
MPKLGTITPILRIFDIATALRAPRVLLDAQRTL